MRRKLKICRQKYYSVSKKVVRYTFTLLQNISYRRFIFSTSIIIFMFYSLFVILEQIAVTRTSFRTLFATRHTSERTGRPLQEACIRHDRAAVPSCLINYQPAVTALLRHHRVIVARFPSRSGILGPGLTISPPPPRLTPRIYYQLHFAESTFSLTAICKLMRASNTC